MTPQELQVIETRTLEAFADVIAAGEGKRGMSIPLHVSTVVNATLLIHEVRRLQQVVKDLAWQMGEIRYCPYCQCSACGSAHPREPGPKA